MSNCDFCNKKIGVFDDAGIIDGKRACRSCILKYQQDNPNNHDLEHLDPVELNSEVTIKNDKVMEPLKRKYESLRLLSNVFRFMAAIVAVMTLLYTFTASGISIFFVIVSGIFAIISLVAAAEIQNLFIDTEENTREIIRQLMIMNKNHST